MNKKIMWFFIVIYTILGFFAIRRFLFSPGILGHNWDWSIPYLPSQLKYLSYRSNFIWNEFGLGSSFTPWGISCILLNKIVGLLGYFGVNGDFISKGLVWLTMVLSGTFMSILIYSLLGEIKGLSWSSVNFGTFIGGLFYGFSPYLFCEFIGGANTQFSTYAFVPLALFFVRRYVLNGGIKNLFFSGIVLLVLGFSLQRLVLTSILLGLYICVASSSRNGGMRRFIMIWVVFFCLSLYWIIPSIGLIKYRLKDIVTVSSELTYFVENIINSVPSLAQIFIGTGYFRTFFNYSVKFYPIWTIIGYFMIAYIFYNNLRARNKEVLFWMGLFLCSLIFASGGKPPLGNVILWLYRNFFIMNLFRSPQHLILVPTLCISILLGYGVSFGYEKMVKIKWIYCPIVLLGLIIWLHPFLYGDLGTSMLKRDFCGGNYIDQYQLTPGYKELDDVLNERKEISRLLPLPMSGSPYYLANGYQSDGQGGDPFIMNIPKPVLVADIAYGPCKTFLPFLEGEK